MRVIDIADGGWEWVVAMVGCIISGGEAIAVMGSFVLVGVCISRTSPYFGESLCSACVLVGVVWLKVEGL